MQADDDEFLEEAKRMRGFLALDWDDTLFPTSYFTRDGLREYEFEDFVEDFQVSNQEHAPLS